MNFTLNSNYKKNKYGEIASNILEQKKSKFISYIFKIDNEKQANEYIRKIKEENKSARHIVYIYSFLNEYKISQINFSDDNEPQGTATKGIYEFITKENITNICIVIVRYFGGILLGVGPLSRAYLRSFKGALDKCKKIEIFEYIDKIITIKYTKYDLLINALKNYVNSRYIIINKTEFNENILIYMSIEKRIFKKINDMLSEILY